MINVLIVEDDPTVAELNRRYLAHVEGFQLHSIANDCRQALKILETGTVDLILVDIFMPGMNGLEMLKKIREAGHGVDVIMVTAARDSASVKKALRLGAVDYLIKPFEFERLNMALQQYKVRVEAIDSCDTVCQRDIDTQVLDRQRKCGLPKGLEKHTLQIVKTAIDKIGAPFTIEELVKEIGVSRVTVRKYLDYLETSGMLTVELMYGSVGRPVNRYIPH
ncbi:response regulator [Sporomusa acidovorans]|uniref:Transcriptional regulatory protein n=1 Tax=Sporomusa acidovorans (strain ATCC 49682 / DSM 3132 / Mol) TaxID=1123286 RepID=A0ABZ3J926_SPOA4|nr:response regulator [Sporomusa acidovorans]OZC16170.1 transcriptional regulatory protein DcuR [Sporomusa acidovorans DSM 3132]SDE29766.1 two-component system, CitB family, response regulator MalR [Sporomusa acidovorans]